MTDPADRDPVLMAVADAAMDAIGKTLIKMKLAPRGVDWRDDEAGFVVRDGFYAALLSERHRGGEAMRERAAKVAEEQISRNIDICGIPCPEHADDVAGAIRALPLTSEPTHER